MYFVNFELYCLILCSITFESNASISSKVKICLSYDKLKHLIAHYTNKKIRLYVDEFMYSTAFCNNFNELKTQYPLSELINNRLFFFIT